MPRPWPRHGPAPVPPSAAPPLIPRYLSPLQNRLLHRRSCVRVFGIQGWIRRSARNGREVIQCALEQFSSPDQFWRSPRPYRPWRWIMATAVGARKQRRQPRNRLRLLPQRRRPALRHRPAADRSRRALADRPPPPSGASAGGFVFGVWFSRVLSRPAQCTPSPPSKSCHARA